MVFNLRETQKLARLDPALRVIKAEQFLTYQNANELIAEGERQRDAIIASAQAAYDAERRRGYQDGLEEARQEQAGSMIEIVCHTVEYFGKVENRMVDLVLEAVRKIIDDFTDRDRVVAVVRSSLSLVRTQKHLNLRVNPQQLEGVREKLDELLSVFPAIEFIDVSGDARLAEDACAIESEIGVVEANISKQIDVLRESFKKALERKL